MSQRQQIPTECVSDCQRWHKGKSRYRPSGALFNPSIHGFAEIGEVEAKRFVQEHHYSHSFPAARFRVGLFRKERLHSEKLAGVAVFSVPMSQAVIPKYLGVQPLEGVELGRFVLLDEVEGNGESWFLSRCFRLLHESIPGIRGVVSFSDPLPRYSEDGSLVKPGHRGTIYRASNLVYRGRSKARTLVLSRDGRVVSERALSKIRNEETGAEYAYRQLLAMGAPRRHLGEPNADYVRRALEEGGFRRERHPGNHCFTLAFR